MRRTTNDLFDLKVPFGKRHLSSQYAERIVRGDDFDLGDAVAVAEAGMPGMPAAVLEGYFAARGVEPTKISAAEFKVLIIALLKYRLETDEGYSLRFLAGIYRDLPDLLDDEAQALVEEYIFPIWFNDFYWDAPVSYYHLLLKKEAEEGIHGQISAALVAEAARLREALPKAEAPPPTEGPRLRDLSPKKWARLRKLMFPT